MIISLIQSYLEGAELSQVIVFALLMAISLFFSLTVHEYAHGKMAQLCGDDTAYMNGRLSLNPFAHLDPIGTLCLLFVGYGWAKPVPVNYRNLRKPRRDIALVSLAGPMANLMLAVAFTAIYSGMFVFFASSRMAVIIAYAFNIAAMINIGLAVFNLIPLPPLDGSKVVACLLPQNKAAKYLMWERYFSLIILVMVIGGRLPVIGEIIDYLWLPIDFVRSLIEGGLFFLFTTLFTFIKGLF